MERPATSTNPFENQPFEVTVHILKLVGARDVGATVSQLSHCMHAAASDQVLWKHFVKVDLGERVRPLAQGTSWKSTYRNASTLFNGKFDLVEDQAFPLKQLLSGNGSNKRLGLMAGLLDGKQVAAVRSGSTIYLHTAGSTSVLTKSADDGYGPSIAFAKWNGSDALFYLDASGRKICVHTKGGAKVVMESQHRLSHLICCANNKGQSYLACVNEQDRVVIWDLSGELKTPQHSAKLKRARRGDALHVRTSHDGQVVAWARGKEILLFHPEQKKFEIDNHPFEWMTLEDFELVGSGSDVRFVASMSHSSRQIVAKTTRLFTRRLEEKESGWKEIGAQGPEGMTTVYLRSMHFQGRDYLMTKEYADYNASKATVWQLTSNGTFKELRTIQNLPADYHYPQFDVAIVQGTDSRLRLLVAFTKELTVLKCDTKADRAERQKKAQLETEQFFREHLNRSQSREAPGEQDGSDSD